MAWDIPNIITNLRNDIEDIAATVPEEVPIATTSTAGKVKPDGTTITVTSDGTISAEEVPIATTSEAGIVKPDGTTITVTSDGTISAAGGGTSESVSVTADGVKTYSELLGDLFNLVDFDKITHKSALRIISRDDRENFFQISFIRKDENKQLRFYSSYGVEISSIQLEANDNRFRVYSVLTSISTTPADIIYTNNNDSTVPDVDDNVIITLYY